MNLKALITSLVLGLSSTASAKPLLSFSAEASVQLGGSAGRPIVRDHRGRTPIVVTAPPRGQVVNTTRPNTVYDFSRDPAQYAEPVYTGPINLTIGGDASAYSGQVFELANVRGTAWAALTEPTRIERGREFVHLTAAGPVRDLMFQSVAGQTSITHVSIQFSDDSTHVVQINQTLTSRNATIDLPLDGRKIVTRVVVYGTSAAGSAYRILGR